MMFSNGMYVVYMHKIYCFSVICYSDKKLLCDVEKIKDRTFVLSYWW